jgi:hypothetical protein
MSDVVYSHNVIIKDEDTTLTSSKTDQYEFVGWSGEIVRFRWYYGDE